MSKTNTYAIFFATMLLFEVVSCKKDNKQPVFLDAALKTYFDYQIGSYWIFFDSASMKADSLFVTAVQDRLPYRDGETANETLSTGMLLNSLDSSYGGSEWSLFLSAPTGSILDIGNTFKYPLNNYMPFQIGSLLISSINVTWTTAHLPSYSNGFGSYSDVYQFVYTYEATPFADTFYLNSGSGFLAILLNNATLHKRLFLEKSTIIR